MFYYRTKHGLIERTFDEITTLVLSWIREGLNKSDITLLQLHKACILTPENKKGILICDLSKVNFIFNLGLHVTKSPCYFFSNLGYFYCYLKNPQQPSQPGAMTYFHSYNLAVHLSKDVKGTTAPTIYYATNGFRCYKKIQSQRPKSIITFKKCQGNSCDYLQRLIKQVDILRVGAELRLETVLNWTDFDEGMQSVQIVDTEMLKSLIQHKCIVSMSNPTEWSNYVDAMIPKNDITLLKNNLLSIHQRNRLNQRTTSTSTEQCSRKLRSRTQETGNDSSEDETDNAEDCAQDNEIYDLSTALNDVSIHDNVLAEPVMQCSVNLECLNISGCSGSVTPQLSTAVNEQTHVIKSRNDVIILHSIIQKTKIFTCGFMAACNQKSLDTCFIENFLLHGKNLYNTFKDSRNRNEPYVEFRSIQPLLDNAARLITIDDTMPSIFKFMNSALFGVILRSNRTNTEIPQTVFRFFLTAALCTPI